MKRLLIVLSLAGLLILSACSTKPPIHGVKSDPYYDSFFEKARLIMSKEEIQIYKHLPNQQARGEFVAEFWAKRDPTPDTEENEIKNEFYERIEYANKWFNESKAGERGWDTERGRILLQIGFPEERQWGELPNTSAGGRLRTTQRIPMERWIYLRYQMVLTFIGDRQGFNSFKLYRIPAQLRTVIDIAKNRLDLGANKSAKNTFKFDADYSGSKIKITIPVKKVSFEKSADKMKADFLIQVFVYRDYEKIDEVEESQSFSSNKDSLLERKTIDFTVAYPPPKKGTYFFDVIVTEKSSGAKYRTFCKHKE